LEVVATGNGRVGRQDGGDGSAWESHINEEAILDSPHIQRRLQQL